MNRKVYSYLRFSAAKQADGASIARQTEYARKWAADHGYALDNALSMRDEGLSAYHQKHVKTGALGVFLEAVNAGTIPAGSVLIVEGLDRLSRAEPMLAQAQLTQIINAGLTVVTAGDGKSYSRESLKATPMDMIYSLLVMIRAHEESETKSKRVKDAAIRAARAWQSGKRVPVPGGRVPQWVCKEGAEYVIIPELAEAMRETVRLYIEGYGAVRILGILKSKGLPPVCLDRSNNIDALLRNQSYLLIGAKVITFGGESFTLEKYYPAIISDDDHNRLIVETAKRKQRPHTGAGKSVVPNLFTGQGICTCGACGELLVSSNRALKDSKGESYIYRRVRCPSCERNGQDAYGQSTSSCPVENLEAAIFDYCSDQLNLNALVAVDNPAGELQKEQTALLSRITQAESKLSRIAEIALEGDGKIPEILIRQMQSLEQQLAADKAREQQLAAEVAVKLNTEIVHASEWSELRAAFLAQDIDARTKARKLFSDTFSGITVNFRATHPATGASAVGLILTSKTGESRLLVIDRKSGAMLEAVKVEKLADNAAVTAVRVSTLATRH